MLKFNVIKLREKWDTAMALMALSYNEEVSFKELIICAKEQGL